MKIDRISPAVLFGFGNAVLGLLVGLLVLALATGEGYGMFPLSAATAGFITGWLFWKLLIGDPRSVTTLRTVLAGVFTGSLSHYCCWLLISIGMNLCYALTGSCTDSLGQPPAPFTTMVTGAFAYSAFSLLFFGWLTIPASIIVGIVVKHRMNKHASADEGID